MGKGAEYCTVVEYRIEPTGMVSRHSLGCLELNHGEDAWQKTERYIWPVCEQQEANDVSIIMITHERYGVNRAAYVCKGGEITKSEGASGWYRAEELVAEQTKGYPRPRKNLFARIFRNI